MHPALSVIFFTTASGAGYGLLALLGISAAAGLLPPDLALGLVGLGLALALISAGLLASTAHLGHPERAWRAFSQWRSSWLSREGVASVLTYVPATALAVGWVILGQLDGWVAAAGVLAALGAAVTVAMSGMIYASIKPVAQWHTPFTLPGYLIFAVMTGFTLFNGLLQGFELGTKWVIVLTVLAAALGWGFKRSAWSHDAVKDRPTLGSATGLGGGEVRSIQWPHTARNYLLKEMGYRIARKHSYRLRIIMQGLAFVGPIILLLLALAFSGWPAIVTSLLAIPVQLTGMLLERWLFFAEATHTVTLYYGVE